VKLASPSFRHLVSRQQLTFVLCLGLISMPAIAEDGVKKEGLLNTDEIARDLANPNTPLASLNLKLQVRTFDGSARHASQQESLTVLLQPTLPFPLSNGDIVLFRPAVPLLVEQPIPAGAAFDSKTGLGDISFDLA
jgi:hypothetical protein